MLDHTISNAAVINKNDLTWYHYVDAVPVHWLPEPLQPGDPQGPDEHHWGNYEHNYDTFKY